MLPDQTCEPTEQGPVDTFIETCIRISFFHKKERRVHEQPSIPEGSQVVLQPLLLHQSFRKRSIQDLGIQDNTVQILMVKTVPGSPESIVESTKRFGCHPLGPHCWIWLIANIPGPDHMEWLQVQSLELIICPASGFLLLGTTDILFGQITQMHDKIRNQCSYTLPRPGTTCWLFLNRIKFHGLGFRI